MTENERDDLPEEPLEVGNGRLSRNPWVGEWVRYLGREEKKVHSRTGRRWEVEMRCGRSRSRVERKEVE